MTYDLAIPNPTPATLPRAQGAALPVRCGRGADMTAALVAAILAGLLAVLLGL